MRDWKASSNVCKSRALSAAGTHSSRIQGKRKEVRAYLNTVGCQEKDALEILQLSEEDADKGISVNVVHIPLLEEDIRFIEEEDSAPGVAHIEDLLQFALEESRVRP